MIDRGFIKWKSFESLVPNKEIIKAIEENKKCNKPVLFPEEISILNDSLIEAYYNQDLIQLTYYEKGKIKIITDTIKKINPNSKIIELGCKKKLYFKQIIHLRS